MNHLVIMAGGVGSRFWPMSTPACPKQFIDVLGVGKTLLQLTVERFTGICPMENVWVVTSGQYRELVREQLPAIPEEHILLEPCMRNTAPCIAYAVWKIKLKDPQANLVVSPADHVVMDVAEFRRVVRKGLKFVAEEDRILTLGILPVRPETGFGYIKIKGAENKEHEIFEVEGFREKPKLEIAERYLKEGGYYWNAGIFLWNVKTIEKAFRHHQPAIASLFDDMSVSFDTNGEQDIINARYGECDRISIDFAIMEKAENIYVFPADFGWSDLGTWGALYRHTPKDANQNAVVGKSVRMIDSAHCLVYVSDGKQVIVEGLEDYIVAEKDGNILVCRKINEQIIKDFL